MNRTRIALLVAIQAVVLVFVAMALIKQTLPWFLAAGGSVTALALAASIFMLQELKRQKTERNE